MKQKIEWYKEVLELEPGSKIFFPLARMLAQDGQPEEALVTLRHGIDRHPDHVEARLLLVELLFEAGRTTELFQEVDKVSALFGGYPGFWKAWGKKLLSSETTSDAGLAVMFLSVFLQHRAVSWAEVIALGLKELLEEQPSSLHSSSPRTETPSSDKEGEGAPLEEQGSVPSLSESQESHSSEELVCESADEDATEPEENDCTVEVPVLEAMPDDPQECQENAHALEEFSSILSSDEEAGENGIYDDAAEIADEEESEEPFSLRTRSMAEVLAEQGDIQGALEIYQELHSAAVSDEEKVSISMRMEELKHRLDPPAPVIKESESKAAEVESSPGKNRLTDMLETLAQRLEARSVQ